MSGVDDRVVAMKFDNEAFQRKLGETITSLDKLRTSLDFANSKKGLDDLGRAGQSFTMGNMGGVVDGISGKFLALSTVAITAISNITLKAISAGTQIVKAFSLDPVLQGFQEYETNMNSIQTVLSNTKDAGTNLQDVNEALDKLNQYSDQTIYNFAQMAKNVGTFTAAGVDLDKSVNAIKGIANLAAISGSNSEQASTAMYQLSQALAAGKVSLMDWNSVVNAGMGGEVFKKALFETGKAMKTITDVPLGTSFEDWEKKGGTFREQMQKGWITADVLSTTLSSFSGDLTEAGLKQLGFGDAAAKKMVELGKMGIAAATEVKTFTQLMSTVKESVASGWSQSFRLVVGDFEEAKKLFTEINAGIGGLVGKSADARNDLLKGWKELGGREELILGFKRAIHGLGEIITPIKEAFRDIFPPMTAQRLYELTQGFTRLMSVFLVAEGNGEKIKRAFAGVFAVLEIGWEVIKNVIGLFKDLLSVFDGGGNAALDFAATTGDSLVALNKALVEGGGIRDFFDKIRGYIQKAAEFLGNFKDNVVEMFEAFRGSEQTENTVNRISDRFDQLDRASGKVAGAWQTLLSVFRKIGEVLDEIFNHLRTWFSELGQKLADAMKPGDFNAAVDAVNVGLLGGILIVLKKFFTQGLKLNFGDGIIENIRNSLDGLTNSLKAMTLNLKANALLKIAAAVGILSASVLVLSLIDSAALTRALTALMVGFGQLVGVMMLMEKTSLGASAVKLTILSAAMIGLATAATILAVAITILSKLSWTELAKGLAGITVGLVVLTGVTKLISGSAPQLIAAGIGLTFLSTGLLILAEAVKSFATMSWGDMAKGFIGVAAGLLIIAGAMNLMPPHLILLGPGLIMVAGGLVILAEAVKSFASMGWTEMGRGLLGITAGLLAIAAAMSLMPPTLPLTAAGLVVVGVALNIIAMAVKSMAELSLEELGKGIGAFAAMLLILVVAVNAMTGALAGAAALLVVAASMMIMTTVLERIALLSVAQIVTGLLAIAGVLLVLGVGASLLGPVIPLMIALGIALMALGAGFALFGVGAALVAKAFEIMAKAGTAGATAMVESTKIMMTAMPQFVAAVVASLVKFIEEIAAAGPVIIKAVTVILGHLLDTIIELMPKIADALGAIISEGLRVIREQIPAVVETGVAVLLALLEGINQNITKIVDLAYDIIIKLLGGIAERHDELISAGVDILVSFISGIDENIIKIVTAGADMVIGLLNGIADTIRTKAPEIRQAGINIATALIDGITGGLASKIGGLMKTVSGMADKVAGAFSDKLKIFSPSKVFMGFGEEIVNGLTYSMDNSNAPESSAKTLADRVEEAFKETLGHIPTSLADMDDLNPVITPVLDLSKVRAASRNIDTLMTVSTITPEVSLDRARQIVTTADLARETEAESEAVPTEVNFIQNNYSPSSLSTNDIYRNTKSQIALAKEELSI